MWSYPAMVLRIHEVRLSPCGAAQARAGTIVSVSRPQPILHQAVYVRCPRYFAHLGLPIFLRPQRLFSRRLSSSWRGLLVLCLHLHGAVRDSQRFPSLRRQLPLPNGSYTPTLIR